MWGRHHPTTSPGRAPAVIRETRASKASLPAEPRPQRGQQGGDAAQPGQRLAGWLSLSWDVAPRVHLPGKESRCPSVSAATGSNSRDFEIQPIGSKEERLGQSRGWRGLQEKQGPGGPPRRPPVQRLAGRRRPSSPWLGPRARPLLLKAPKNTHASHPFQAARRPFSPAPGRTGHPTKQSRAADRRFPPVRSEPFV